MECLQLLDCADVVDHLVMEILLFQDVLVDYKLFLLLFFQIHNRVSFLGFISLGQRLENVGVLAKIVLSLSELYFDIGNVANLVCSENSKYAVLFQDFSLPLLESLLLDVILLDDLTGQILSEERHDGLHIARHHDSVLF
jgi:hypothetical protein